MSVKSAILRAYELVLEAYRQPFRKHKKSPTQSRSRGAVFEILTG